MDYTLKKSLGQHFLVDESVSERIVQYLMQHPPARLLEVGPGGAALTKHLLELKDVDLLCVELDAEKVGWLEKNFPALKGKIIHQSVLDIAPPFEGRFTVVGNFPYNISSQIVFRIIEWKNQVECMIGMFQKEVAERIAAHEGSKTYGVTSVLVQAFFDVEYLFEVGQEAFNPPPKVKSAVIRFLPRKASIEMHTQKALFTVVKAAFNQRRKTLRNALKPLFSEEILKEELFNKRAEQLSVEEFAALTFRLKSSQ